MQNWPEMPHRSKVYTAIATQPPAMKVHKRGSVSSLGDEVPAAGLAAVQGLEPSFGLRPDAIESHRRLQLASTGSPTLAIRYLHA